ncbi:hypothetical protein Tco_0740866 [Tanacetum coccineum]
MPREMHKKIIESKSKVCQSQSKAIVSKVNTSSSTLAVSSDVAELKDMVRALILDKKNQTPAPAPVKAVEQSVDGIYDSEGDTVYLEELLSVINNDPSLPPSPVCEINVPEKIKSSCKDPPDLELKDLPSHLEYAFFEGDDKLPFIIAKNLKDEDKTALDQVGAVLGEQIPHILSVHKHSVYGTIRLSNTCSKQDAKPRLLRVDFAVLQEFEVDLHE